MPLESSASISTCIVLHYSITLRAFLKDRGSRSIEIPWILKAYSLGLTIPILDLEVMLWGLRICETGRQEGEGSERIEGGALVSM